MARIRTLRSDSLAVQRDEIDSMAAIFADDFIRLSPDRDDDDDDDDDDADDDDESAPISYAIRLVVSNLSSSSSFLSNDNGNAVPATTGTVVKATAHGSPPIAIDYELALGITYPPDYPAHSMPIFHLHYENDDNSNNNNSKKKKQLHYLQEEAILQCAINIAASSSSSNHHPHSPNNNDDGEDEEEVEGMPCAYDCVLAVQEFIRNCGLDQAGLFILSSGGGGGGDDVLAHILSYVLSSKEDIATVCTSLPLIFPIDGSVVKSNVLWKELCARHWRTKWGFHNRWKKYVDAFRLIMQQSSSSSSSSTTTTKTSSSTKRTRKNNHNINHGQYFWMQAYHYEEADASRTHMTQHELHSMTFDYRTWFSVSSLRNQPENMRDVLPTGLKTTIAKDVVFSKNVPAAASVVVAGTTTTTSSSSIPGGSIMSNDSEQLSHLVWEGLTNNVTKHRTKRIDNIHDDYDDDDDANDNGAITGIDLKPLSSNSSSSRIESLVVGRLPNWGWELRGANSIFRALDDDNNNGEEEDIERRLWEDLTTKMIIQERPFWITTYRTRWETNYREIPDDEDCKMLHW